MLCKEEQDAVRPHHKPLLLGDGYLRSYQAKDGFLENMTFKLRSEGRDCYKMQQAELCLNKMFIS
jgi:hypothetical protein